MPRTPTSAPPDQQFRRGRNRTPGGGVAQYRTIRHGADGRGGREALRRDYYETQVMYGTKRTYRSHKPHSIEDNAGVMRRERPIRVCHIAPSLDLLGGQSIQAARLLEGLKEAPEVEAELLPINPALPGPLRRLQRIKYARSVVNTIATLILLIVRLPRYDIVQVYAASYFSFLLTPAPAVLIAKLYGKRVILHYHSGE